VKLSLGFSPCPNDTFIFDALVHQKIDTHGLSFEVHLEDVETLNQWALEGKLDITKISFAAFCRAGHPYRLLTSGAALGRGVGPLLIAKQEGHLSGSDQKQIALPGNYTTAHFLLRYALPDATDKIFMPFHQIEDWVLADENNQRMGVIIHENRFTYAAKGLHQIADLGAYWEAKTALPIPLGGIAMKKDFDPSVSALADQLIKQSLEYALARYPSLPPYVKEHAQEMDEDVMRRHIDLYVNDYSLALNDQAYRAIEMMRKEFENVGM
jgi:1,4-dihydroxy-6-naphthoate synthase